MPAGAEAPPPARFAMVPDAERAYLVVAVRGSGKSTLVAAIARAFRSPHNLVVVVDPKQDKAMRKLQPMATTRIRPRGGGLVRLVPAVDTAVPDAPCSTTAEPAMAAIFARGNCTVVVDELQMVASQSHYPPSLFRIYAQGRARRISVVAISTEPVRIPVWVRSQSLTRIVGQVGESGQRDYCADLLWMDRREFQARMEAMPRYHFLLRAQEWVAERRPAEEVWVRP